MKKIIILLAAVFALSACDKTYTVSDFKSDPKLRKEYHDKCINGELNTESQNCTNVDEAMTTL